MNTTTKILSASAVGLVLLTFSGLRTAQADAAGEEKAKTTDDLAEIVVTARRREEILTKVPVAISALNTEALHEKVVESAEDLDKIPGLKVDPQLGGQPSINLRGQGQGFATNQPSVITYFAEVPGFEQSYYDLDSLQVVKGPQGTLFGETATAGAVLYTPKKPTNELNGYFRLQGGDFDYKSFEGAIGGPIIDDTLLVRAALQTRNRKGWIEAYSSFGAPPTDMRNDNEQHWRLSALLRLGDNFENYTIYSGSRVQSNGDGTNIRFADPVFLPPSLANLPISLIPPLAIPFQFYTGYAPPAGKTYAQLVIAAFARQNAAGPYATFYNYNQSSVNEFTGFINQTRWDVLSNFTVRNIFGVYWTRTKGALGDTDASDLSLIDTRGLIEPGSTNPNNPVYAWTGGTPAATYTDEFQLLGKLFDNRLQWQTGAYYRNGGVGGGINRDYEPDTGARVFFATAYDDPASAQSCAALKAAYPCSTLSRQTAESYALYSQETFAVTPTINFTAGYRRTWDESSETTTATNTAFTTFEGMQFPLPVAGRAPIPGAGELITDVPRSGHNSYNLTADWQMTDSMMAYVAHRQGYKSGGVNQDLLVNDPNRTFGPETIKDVEVGLKSSWQLGSVRGLTTIAAYRDWYDHIQRTTSLGNTLETYTANIASATINGVEFESTVHLTDWFRLSGNFTFTDGKYTSWDQSTTCGSLFYLPICSSLPSGTPVLIDHAGGRMTANGQTVAFKPDLFNDAPKYGWSIQPSFSLAKLVGEDISISGNIYHRSQSATGVAAANYSLTAGLAVPVLNTIIGPQGANNLFVAQGFTLADLRMDWRHIRLSKLSAAAVVTNVTNQVVNSYSQSGLQVIGLSLASIEAPRMWYLELSYEL